MKTRVLAVIALIAGLLAGCADTSGPTPCDEHYPGVVIDTITTLPNGLPAITYFCPAP